MSGNYVDPRFGKVTFASFYKEWSARQVWVQGTRNAMDLAARSVTFGDVPFVDLRPSHAETWVKKMVDDGLQASTIKTRFVNVRGAIRAAVRDQMVSKDVTVNVKLPRQRKAEAAMAIPTPAEVGQLLTFDDHGSARSSRSARSPACAWERPPPYRWATSTSCAERSESTDRFRGPSGSGVEIRAPKYGSERTVYAPDGLLEMLSEHIKDRVFEREQ